MSSIGAERLTFEAWRALPETRQRYDIVNGVMLIAPAPTPIHQWIMMEMTVRLKGFVEEKELGVVFAAPVDLLIQRDPLRTSQPDILYLNSERTGILGIAESQGLQYLDTPPDLVEVLSPSNTRGEIEDRLGATGKSVWLNAGWSARKLRRLRSYTYHRNKPSLRLYSALMTR